MNSYDTSQAFGVRDEVRYVQGEAWAAENPLANNWLVGGQCDTPQLYSVPDWETASMLVQTVDHYNRTGEVRQFDVRDIGCFHKQCRRCTGREVFYEPR